MSILFISVPLPPIWHLSGFSVAERKKTEAAFALCAGTSLHLSLLPPFLFPSHSQLSDADWIRLERGGAEAEALLMKMTMLFYLLFGYREAQTSSETLLAYITWAEKRKLVCLRPADACCRCSGLIGNGKRFKDGLNLTSCGFWIIYIRQGRWIKTLALVKIHSYLKSNVFPNLEIT